MCELIDEVAYLIWANRNISAELLFRSTSRRSRTFPIFNVLFFKYSTRYTVYVFISNHPSVRTTGTRFHKTAFTLATLYAQSSTRFLPPKNTDTQMVKNSTIPCVTNCAITINVSATRFPSFRNRSNRSIASFLGFMSSASFPCRSDTHPSCRSDSI